MISVFDTNPVIFESNDRTLTISYNGVLCKDANGTVITDIDFEDVNEAVKKIEEEINEVLDVYKSNNMEKIINEVGDLLFACVNVARLLNVDEEEALNKSIKKFVKRFKFVEENLLKQDKNLNDSTLDEMNALWEDSKKYD